MKIKTIETENFKSSPDRVVALDKVNVCLGDNGKGKTSFLNSLWYLFTNNLPVDPIRHGEDHLRVMAVLDDGQNTTIEKLNYLSDTFKINGENVKTGAFSKAVEQAFNDVRNGLVTYKVDANESNQFFLFPGRETSVWEFFNTGKVSGQRIYGVKECAIELSDGTNLYMRKSTPSKVTVDGKSTTIKALNQMIGARMNGNIEGLELVTSSMFLSAMEMKDFAKRLISIIPITVDYPLLEKLAALTVDEAAVLKPLFPAAPAPISISDIQSVYKTLFAVRTDIKRDLEAWRKRSIFTRPLPIRPYNLVKADIDEVNQKIAEAKQIQKLVDAYNKAVSDRQALVDTVQKWTEEYNALGKVEQVNKEDLTKAMEEEAALRLRIQEWYNTISKLRQANIPIEKMLKNLDTTVCPLCDSLVCNTDKSSCKADLLASIENNNSAANDIQSRINFDEKALTDISLKIESLRNAMVAFEKKMSIYQRIENLKKNIPALPEKPDTNVDITALETRLAHLQEELNAATLWNECINANQKANEIQVKYNLYCDLIKKAEPKKGLLTNTLLEYILNPFKTHVNEFIKDIHGDAEVTFKMDEDGLQVYCRPHGRGTFTTINGLSTGEKMLVVFALMDMISNLSNTKLLVFDCLEELDGKTLDNLMASLMQQNIQDRYDHIILSSVNHSSIRNLMNRYSNRINIIEF